MTPPLIVVGTWSFILALAALSLIVLRQHEELKRLWRRERAMDAAQEDCEAKAAKYAKAILVLEDYDSMRRKYVMHLEAELERLKGQATEAS